MKKALKVTQSGKNGKSYFYVEKEVLQNDLTTKIVWVRISENEAREMLLNDHTVSDMTFKGDNATTIYAVNVDDALNNEAQGTEQLVNNEADKTLDTVESDIEATLNKIKSIDLMINEAQQAQKSSVVIKYMNQKNELVVQLAELKHKLFVLKYTRA